MVGDILLGEIRRTVISLKLVFYKDYNLLIYLKSTLAAPSRIIEVKL